MQKIKKGAAKVSSKGQLTIPAWARKDLGIKEGSLLNLYEVEGQFLVIEQAEVTPLEEIQARFQKLASKKGLTPEALTQAIKESRKKVFKRLYEKTA